MDQEQLRQVYEMVDSIPFTRSKKNISRDFSDGVMMAQLIYHYRPKSVQLHSYPAASSAIKKIANWQTLNNKVLKKLGLGLTKKQIQDIVNCIPMAIQNYLYTVLMKFQSPAQEVNVRQQIKKVQISQNNKIKQPNIINPNQTSSFNQTQKIQQKQLPTKEMKANLTLSGQSEEVLKLIDQIENAYTQLLKLQQKSKLTDQVIKNLEKKVEKMVFS